MALYTKKVCLLGEFAVGKTSLIRRFVYNLFDDSYISTIGVKVSRKVLPLPQETDIAELTLMLWDISSNQEFNQVRASYLRGAAGAVLVCDLTRPETIRSLPAYVAELHAVSPHARLIIAANKSDLAYEPLALAQLKATAADCFAAYILTSAKTGARIDDLFRDLGRLLLF